MERDPTAKAEACDMAISVRSVHLLDRAESERVWDAAHLRAARPKIVLNMNRCSYFGGESVPIAAQDAGLEACPLMR